MNPAGSLGPAIVSGGYTSVGAAAGCRLLRSDPPAVPTEKVTTKEPA